MGKLVLKIGPNDRVHLKNGTIKNESLRSHFSLEGSIPALRDKDIIEAHEAQSDLQKIWLTLQEMYLDEKWQLGWGLYEQILNLREKSPELLHELNEIFENVQQKKFYPAIKLVKSMVERDNGTENAPAP